MKYTSRSTTKTTVKVFDITDIEPVQIGFYKTPTLVDSLEVTYVEGKDGLKKISWRVRGRNILNSGKPGQQDRRVADWYQSRITLLRWAQDIADKNTPWGDA